MSIVAHACAVSQRVSLLVHHRPKLPNCTIAPCEASACSKIVYAKNRSPAVAVPSEIFGEPPALSQHPSIERNALGDTRAALQRHTIALYLTSLRASTQRQLVSATAIDAFSSLNK